MTTAMRRKDLLLLLLIVLVAAVPRLVNLGGPSFRADTIHFWNLAQSNASASQIWAKWMEIMGLTGQFPFPLASMKACLDATHAPVTHFTVRLPFALWGVLAVIFLYGAGTALGGRRIGNAAGMLLAVSTFHILVSREAYFYSSMVAGTCLLLWSVMDAWACAASRRPPGRWFYARLAGGFFLTAYSQPSGWGFTFLATLTVLGCLAWDAFRQRRATMALLLALGLVLVLGAPLLVTDWALPQVRQVASQSQRDYTHRVFIGGPGLGMMLFRMSTAFCWGSTPLRTILSFLALGAGLLACVRSARKDPRFAFVPVLIACGFLLFLVGQLRTGIPFEPRYVLSYLAPLQLLLAVGLLQGGEFLADRLRVTERRRAVVTAAPIACAIALMMAPAATATQLRGKPTPYKDIQTWVDRNLPPASLVLVDRWYEPWNELQVYPSTNVFFAFTVPNEPLDTFLQVRWRETAKQFFAKFPDAAFLEINRQYWEQPSVGPWDWPSQWFRQKVTFTNEAGVKLRHLGLANRGDFYGVYTNRLVVDLYYNTRDDVVQKLKSEGRRAYAFFGPGWGYEKLWRQSRDFRDWRVLTSRAAIDVYNLADEPVSIDVVLQGVAAGGAKQVEAAPEVKKEFPGGKMQAWRLTLPRLAPGLTQIVLQDSLWDLGQVPLLVESLSAEPSKSSIAPGGP